MKGQSSGYFKNGDDNQRGLFSGCLGGGTVSQADDYTGGASSFWGEVKYEQRASHTDKTVGFPQREHLPPICP
jgi:hypothetical protein